MLSIGDKVQVTNPHKDNLKYAGKTGTVEKIFPDGEPSIGLVGLDGEKFPRLMARIVGYPAFTEDELTRI